MRYAAEVNDMRSTLAGNPDMSLADAAFYVAVRTGGNPVEILTAYLDARHA